MLLRHPQPSANKAGKSFSRRGIEIRQNNEIDPTRKIPLQHSIESRGTSGDT